MLSHIKKSIFAQVIVALILGVILGAVSPTWAMRMKPLGDGFIKLIQVFIAPVVFCVVVNGIAGVDSIGKVGRVGLKTVVYFEAVTTLALAIGVLLGLHSGIGVGMNIDPASLDTGLIASYAEKANTLSHSTAATFILNMIPKTAVGAFSGGDILQVLVFSILFACALNLVKDTTPKVVELIQEMGTVFFKVMGMVVKLAPLGVFGAVSFTIGKYGVASMQQLGAMVLFYFITCILFVVVVLGLILKVCGFSLWQFLRYFKEEIFIVFGTTASDCVLPQIMQKLKDLGIKDSIVGLVIPTGYSFNLDGFSIYLTLAVIFIANATNTALGLEDMLLIIVISMITSKGAHGIPGSAIVILLATLTAFPALPAAGLVLVLPMDWFIGIARAVTNLIGNCIATLVIARWEGEVDLVKARQVLAAGALKKD